MDVAGPLEKRGNQFVVDNKLIELSRLNRHETTDLRGKSLPSLVVSNFCPFLRDQIFDTMGGGGGGGLKSWPRRESNKPIRVGLCSGPRYTIQEEYPILTGWLIVLQWWSVREFFSRPLDTKF